MEDIIKETDASLFFINGEREEEIKKGELEEKDFYVCFAMLERLLG